MALPEPADICFVEIYGGPVRVVRHLSGPRLGRRVAVRLNAHARRWPPGTRLLVVTVPFQDSNAGGEFASWWDSAEDDGVFCEEARNLGDPRRDTIARAFERGFHRRFKARGYPGKVDFRCIRG